MDDFDLGGFDTEYYGGDFGGGSSGMDTGSSSWGMDTEVPWDTDFSNQLGSMDLGQGLDWGSGDPFNLGGQNFGDMYAPGDAPNFSAGQAPAAFGNFPSGTGGTSDALGKLFTNPQLLMKGLGAIFEGQQNKKYASKLREAGLAAQRASDPFGRQRGQYQQLLSQSYTDPNVVLGRPEIQAQLAGMRQQMERRDAAAGRRSQYGDRENQLAIQAAGLVDKYRQQLAQLAGAQFGGNSSSLAQLFGQAARPDTQGYVSPILNVLGNAAQGSSISDLLSSLRG